jgi:ATP-dependent Clp protease, protease subunit
MIAAASTPDDPRFPGFPPEVPFPPQPGPVPPGPGWPGHPPVPMVPMPSSPQPQPPDDVRSHVYERMLARRTVMLDRELDAGTATLVAAQLMTLDADGAERITVLVNSPGGPLDAAAAVLDTIDLVRGPVDTTCLGQAAGTAAAVVAAGTGRRRIGAGAQVWLRLADVALAGPAGRVDADLTYLRDLRRTLIDRLAGITGQDRQLVERDIDAGRSLTAPEAVAYGLVDEVIQPGSP